MTRMVCKHCGSEDVWRDAIAVWNGNNWELSDVMTVSHCDACDGETTIVEIKGGEAMKYRVEVVMTNVYYIEADDEAEARRIASEDYIWGEDAAIHMNVAEDDQ